MFGTFASQRTDPRAGGPLAPREPRWLWLAVLFLVGGPVNPVAWYWGMALDRSGDMAPWVLPLAASLGAAFAVVLLHRQPRTTVSVLVLSAITAAAGWILAMTAYVMLGTAELLALADPPAWALAAPLLLIPTLFITLPIAVILVLVPALLWGGIVRVVAFKRTSTGPTR